MKYLFPKYHKTSPVWYRGLIGEVEQQKCLSITYMISSSPKLMQSVRLQTIIIHSKEISMLRRLDYILAECHQCSDCVRTT